MNQKKVAVLFANGFEEGEALFVVDILRRGDIICDTVSIDEKTVTGSHNITVLTDKLLQDININDYDMVILPGGQPGADNLRDCEEVIEWIKEFDKQDKYIAAICAAPQVLAKAGVIKGRKVTSYPAEKYKEILKETDYQENLVVVDNNVITSRGPATTFPFAYKLIEILGGNSEELKEKMLYNNLIQNIKKEL